LCSHCTKQESKEDEANQDVVERGRTSASVHQVNGITHREQQTQQATLQWTDEEIKRAQSNDVHIKPIYRKVQKNDHGHKLHH
jgi:hypothetical protein